MYTCRERCGHAGGCGNDVQMQGLVGTLCRCGEMWESCVDAGTFWKVVQIWRIVRMMCRCRELWEGCADAGDYGKNGETGDCG